MPKRKFVIIDQDTGRRRNLARALVGLGTCVSAVSAHEIADRWPTRCRVLVHDEGDCLANLLAWLESGRLSVPFIPYSNAPAIERVVETLHRGAASYLDWPCSHDLLCRTLELAEGKAQEIFDRNEAYIRTRCLVDVLTPRERQVLYGMFNGCTGKEIARDLGISPRTVETYRANIFEKLDVRNTVEVVRLLATTLPELDMHDLHRLRIDAAAA